MLHKTADILSLQHVDSSLRGNRIHKRQQFAHHYSKVVYLFSGFAVCLSTAQYPISPFPVPDDKRMP
jgi:hypothetical protein